MSTIAYLMNTYPVTSTTFIRREISAIEAQGQPVLRYALRCWSEPLVDLSDKEEQAKTCYILSGQVVFLFAHFFLELGRNPLGMWRALMTWGHLVNNARSGLIAHIAYLLEAASLRHRTRKAGVDHIHRTFPPMLRPWPYYANVWEVQAIASRLMGLMNFST